MIKINNKENCCGCHACFNICPTEAIEMLEDEKGFLYPTVNKEKCINCGACNRVCPIINKKSYNSEAVAYACINKNEKIRKNSSSGGIFTLIAEAILNMGGIVFGAQFDNEFNIVHSYIKNKNELYKFRGSKYVQSTIGDTYKKVKQFLENGKIVLFTGTPCQIEGIYNFLGKEYKNLYTQDIICHGVPSPKVWKKYKDYIEKESNSKIEEVNFRNKKYGWKNFSLKYVLKNNKNCTKTLLEDKFIKLFLANFILRDSCYNCKFKTKKRKSDITLADFWGIENVDRSMYDDKGTSLVIVNSLKGKELFDKIKEKMLYRKEDLEEAIKFNSAMLKSVEQPKNRNEFFEELENYDNFNKLVDRYIPKRKLIQRIKSKAKSILEKIKYKIK